jgi:hypothetical protein
MAYDASAVRKQQTTDQSSGGSSGIIIGGIVALGIAGYFIS